MRPENNLQVKLPSESRCVCMQVIWKRKKNKLHMLLSQVEASPDTQSDQLCDDESSQSGEELPGAKQTSQSIQNPQTIIPSALIMEMQFPKHETEDLLHHFNLFVYFLWSIYLCLMLMGFYGGDMLLA